jgi:copper chaperone NosL
MNSNEKKIGLSSKVMLVIAGVLLVFSLFNPIWRIELDAPQYPEGLALTIHANKLAGDVNIINGLNHYIGMKTLHEEEFIEFTVLPYIISFYALACFIVVFVKNKKALYFLFSAFVLFGIIAMYDFWRWEYNYGHNLDPNAAIIVPGMAYQPPLIGFKQLLNFGAYSVPDIGGWLFILSGLLMAFASILELNFFRKRKKIITSIFPFLLVVFSSCGENKPEPIKLNTDNCDYCGMTISNPKFGAELITEKGRAYKFDDISCMINYKNENVEKATKASFYISDFLGKNDLIDVETAFFIEGEEVKSPMGGNIAAFSSNDSASVYAKKISAVATNWKTLNK